MFSFFKKKKTPDEFLSHILNKLENMEDHSKCSFVEQNIADIKDALANVSEIVNHHHGSMYSIPDDTLETEEWSRGYLDWYYPLLEAMEDDGAVINVKDLSAAAKFFVAETKEDLKRAFAELFAINPVIAMQSIHPAELLEREVIREMERLAHHTNTRLYFDCYDAIGSFNEGEEKRADRTSRLLAHGTIHALQHLLRKEPEVVLFPQALSRTAEYSHLNRLENFLSYLPEEPYRENFISDHMDVISVAIRAIAENATDEHLSDVNNLYYACSDDKRPAELSDLKDLMLSERVKKCFRLAAGNERHLLSKAVLALDGEKSELVKIYSHYEDEPFTPTYELLRLANPDISPLEPEQDNGVNSKHLWMIRKSDKVLAAAFAKAGLIDYVTVQTQHAPAEMPTARDIAQYLYQPPATQYPSII